MSIENVYRVIMTYGPMKPVVGRVLSSLPFVEECDHEACLSQKAPEAKRIDVQQRVFNEKKQKHVWKTLVRYHQDCPVHGCNPRSE